MRHFLLALLIALLPLRGWVGDAMAMAGVAHPAPQAQAHPASPTHAGHHSHPDSQGDSLAHPSSSSGVVAVAASSPANHAACDEHGGAAHAGSADPDAALNTIPSASSPPPADEHRHVDADAGEAAETSETSETAHQHKSCEVCNGPALALSSEAAANLPQPHQVQAATAVRFASTVLPQGIKPPIS